MKVSPRHWPTIEWEFFTTESTALVKLSSRGPVRLKDSKSSLSLQTAGSLEQIWKLQEPRAVVLRLR